jgi:hypothetical protein
MAQTVPELSHAEPAIGRQGFDGDTPRSTARTGQYRPCFTVEKFGYGATELLARAGTVQAVVGEAFGQRAQGDSASHSSLFVRRVR